MASYILREIDPEFWARVKRRVESEGRGLKWVVLRLLELYAKVGLDALEKSAKR